MTFAAYPGFEKRRESYLPTTFRPSGVRLGQPLMSVPRMRVEGSQSYKDRAVESVLYPDRYPANKITLAPVAPIQVAPNQSLQLMRQRVNQMYGVPRRCACG